MKIQVSNAVIIMSLVLVQSAWAAPSVEDNRIESDTTFSRAARYLGSCFESADMATCLAVKGITALNRAARSNNIVLSNGVTFKRDPLTPVQRSGRAMSEKDLFAQLPENADERSGHLVDMAVESATDFLGSHTLEVKIPAESTQQIARALDEGRGKLKKMLGPLVLAIGAKLFAVVPLILGGLALLTTKAIVAAKIALILALLVGSSKFFGGIGNKFGGAVGGGYSANAGWSAPASAGWSAGSSSSYPYARSMSDAHELAYAGQVKSQ